MLSLLVQVKAQTSSVNAEPYFYFLKTTKALHTKQSEKILTGSNGNKELSRLGFFRHLIQKEDSLSLKPNKKIPNKKPIKIPSLLGIKTIIPIEPIISNLPNTR